MREHLGLARCWSVHDSPQGQVYAQNRADEEFEWYCKQAKLLGMVVSPIKRSLRPWNDEDGKPWIMRYYLRTVVEGSEQDIQHLKDILDRKCPPVYAVAI